VATDVMSALYERFTAIVTFSALPFAWNAALLGQMEANDLDAIATLGLVVRENAVMIIDLLFDTDCRQGNAVRVARRKAWLSLLRRAMMTIMAAILGTLPLMLGAGIGSELFRLLGLAIVRQVLLLFTTRHFYFDRLTAALAGRRPARRRWRV
jgi:multidrug efflux pump